MFIVSCLGDYSSLKITRVDVTNGGPLAKLREENMSGHTSPRPFF